jgi:SHS family lactate transporter-like MFS transporter
MISDNASRLSRPLTRSDRFHAVAAGFLGWTLDAFDFFVVVFLLDILAAQFGVQKRDIVWTLTITLAMRPVGAVLFGLLADRYGRRIPLMANVVFFSVVELLCGFAPNFATFVVLRALYGIGMGGEWGVGASLAMELAPPRWRGVLSGILQNGYSIGLLLAAMAARFVLPVSNWRVMFWLGGIPALLALYIRSKVPESEAWHQHRESSISAILRTVRRFSGSIVFLVFMMTLFMFLSHGTQDLYPDFLKSFHRVAPRTSENIVMISCLGALLGGIIFGEVSQRIGRRYGIICALALCILVIPLWAFSGTLALLAFGAFLMQVGVQGAWGIVPAHLNEIAPDSARGLVPGLAYQLGILFAAPVNNIEYALRDKVGYQWALAGFEVATIVLLGIVVLLGRENKGKSFVAEKVMAASVPVAS